jgi:hypothetical protein
MKPLEPISISVQLREKIEFQLPKGIRRTVAYSDIRTGVMFRTVMRLKVQALRCEPCVARVTRHRGYNSMAELIKGFEDWEKEEMSIGAPLTTSLIYLLRVHFINAMDAIALEGEKNPDRVWTVRDLFKLIEWKDDTNSVSGDR